MSAYARWLFGLAAAANFAVGGAFLFAQPLLVGVLGLDPIAGTNRVLVGLAGVLIAGFGYGYVRIALDPGGCRALIHVGALGKIAAVAVVLIGAVLIPHAWGLFVLVSGDLILAALFLHYLRRTRAS
jgi:hypothetical protein